MTMKCLYKGQFAATYIMAYCPRAPETAEAKAHMSRLATHVVSLFPAGHHSRRVAHLYSSFYSHRINSVE